ncbi:MAG: class I SAM-dependent methyltransferase, partial [Candidatus Omnitrophica bacterium]|nr:class I SAM-dependent methyltransferase [Candidatus Omnitrophota bacterium]
MKEIKCDLCGSNHNVVIYRPLRKTESAAPEAYLITENVLIPPEKILKCVTCGLVFVPSGESAEKIIKQYKEMVDDGYIEEEQGRRKTARMVLKKLQRYQKKGKSLMDVGCSTGFFLDEAKKKGWQVRGVELSLWAAKIAREKFGIEVINSTLKQAKLTSNSFDVIVLHDTIEHVLDPREMLIEIRRILKPDGVVYINTPDIQSIVSRVLKARWW